MKEYATIVKINGESSGLRPGMTAVVEILVAELTGVLVRAGRSRRRASRSHLLLGARLAAATSAGPCVLGMSNNIEIEVKDGLAEGDVVILNPRAIVAEARDDDDGAPAVDVKQRFGDAPPPGAAEKSSGPEAGAGEKGKRGGRPRNEHHGTR